MCHTGEMLDHPLLWLLRSPRRQRQQHEANIERVPAIIIKLTLVITIRTLGGSQGEWQDRD